MTVLLTLLLASLGWFGIDDAMTPYQALAHAFATMPTGGFSPNADSLEGFSPAAQWIIALFMFLAGMNFVLLYRGLARRRPRLFVGDEEFRLYAVIVLIASIALLVQLWGYGIASGEEAVRTAVFQAISIITTTGFATTDFALWPVISLLTLFALMFAGGSAGSTTGSIKIVRHLLLGKVLRRELDQTVSPEVVMPIRYNGAPVDERTLRAIAAFILLYVGFWAVGASVIAIDSAISNVPLSALDTLAVSASALGNGGPELRHHGPDGLVRPARRRLEADDDRPHVARTPRDHPRLRPRHPPLLASLTRRSPAEPTNAARRGASGGGRAPPASARPRGPDHQGEARSRARRAPCAPAGRRR